MAMAVRSVRLAWLAVSLGGWSTVARADCPASAADLRAEVDAALAAYQDWAWPKFEAALAAARRDVACLGEVASPELARDLHVLVAFAAFREDDATQMEAALRGVLAVDPDWQPTVDQAAPGSTIHTAYELARRRQPQQGRVVLGEGAWFVDGRPGVATVSLGRCAVVQHRDEAGTLHTWYLTGTKLPGAFLASIEAPAAASPVAAPPEAAPPADDRRRRATWVIAGGLGAGVASAGSLLVAAHMKQVYESAATSEEAIDAYRANYFWGMTGYTVGALGAGMVVGAVLWRAW